MSKFHSTVSRRDFMKALGLTGASLGAAAATAPVFHDLDEVMSAPQSEWKRPWYVKKIDKPTVEIEWDQVIRFDQTNAFIETPEELERLIAKKAQMQQEGLDNKTPGYSLKDIAMYNACEWLRKYGLNPGNCFLGPQGKTVQPPESFGVPPWQGTPEENATMLRVALRFFGASTISFAEINNDTKHMIWAKDSSGIPYVFEDVDKPEETKQKRVIPNKYNNMIVYSIRMPDNLLRYSGGGESGYMGSFSSFMAYSRIALIEGYIQDFLRGLGYQGLGGGSGAIGPSSGWGLMSGIGEIGRVSYMVTPEHGPLLRSPCRMITNLPVAFEKPIDAGITRFCDKCRICAEVCPPGSLSTESEATWEVTGPWNTPGYRAYRVNYLNCLPWRGTSARVNMTTGEITRKGRGEMASSCCMCMQRCVFQKSNIAAIHNVIKGVVGTTSIFNGFFTNMDKLFNYNQAYKNPEDWWHDLNQPIYGYDQGIE